MQPVPAETAIRTVGLTKRYGDIVAVDDLHLEIRQGEIFGLLGANGAGKTSTILMLLGLTEPSAGRVEVAGLDPTRAPLPVKSIVGYLPDDVGFYDDLTARQNLAYTAALNRVPAREAAARIDQLLDDVGLSDGADRRVRGFSRGMRQRLGLADALVKQPRILILDEPTVNIDPEGVRDLLALVDRLRRDQGVTVLLSSHLLHQVELVCDRIGIFVRGRLVACGPIEELAADAEDRWAVRVGVVGVADAGTVLGSVDGVTRVVNSGGTWTVHATRDVRPGLLDAVVDAGGSFTHLSREGADLDAVYHRYFHGEPVNEPLDEPVSESVRERANTVPVGGDAAGGVVP